MSEFRLALGVMCRRVLHPLVRILMRYGVSAGELKSIVDSVYAHAGSDYLVKQGERVTYSKLAVITGINRAFLPGILANPKDEFHPRSSTQLHRATRVLNGWYNDKLFQTSLGEPADLPVEGKPHSFRHLVQLYSGGVYHQTMLSELMRVGAIRLEANNRVRAIRKSPVSDVADIESIQTTAEVAGDILDTLEHNLRTPTRKQLPVRTLIGRVDPQALPSFGTQVNKRAVGLLAVTGRFLRSHKPEGGRTDDGNSGVEVGVAVIAVRRAPSLPHQSGPGRRRKRNKNK